MQIDKLLRKIEKIIPRKLYKALQPYYHLALAIWGTVIHVFPGRHIHIVAITGTKGKSTTTEYVNAVLESAGYKTAILSTIRFKIGDENKPNKYKMTMPGRFFVQRFVKDAEKANCEFAIIEMTSEGARFYRHRGLSIDTLIFTNLTPEHIESHGSFENYLKAKLSLAKAVEKSKKGYKRIIANLDDEYGHKFLIYNVHERIGYKYNSWDKDYKNVQMHLPGEFNKMNALAAITFGKSLHIPDEKIIKGIEGVKLVPGRCEEIKVNNKTFAVIDYAHTADSLEKLYKTYKNKGNIVVAVLGGTGGGRDKDRRRIMGALAAEYATHVIVTDEDPYDEDPRQIMEDVRVGAPNGQIIESRREAINKAISISLQTNACVSQDKDMYILLTGKGTDPYIMRAKGGKEIWDDATVVREEIELITKAIKQ